jgi:hopanoid biosynthesis associated protein HpnK
VDRSNRIAPQERAVQLIVNADDFGRTHEINVAVAQAYDQGIVTSASLMVSAGAVDEAASLARARPGLAVGLHVVVLGGRAILSPAAIPHLVDEAGRFRRHGFTAGVRYFFSRAAQQELAREVRAQFEAFRATGLPLSHVDGHHHMHLHPTVFSLLLPLAQEYGARGVRARVSDELWFSLRGDSSRPALKLAWKLTFFLLEANAVRLLRSLPVPAAGQVYGLMQTGRVSERYLVRLAERLARRRDRGADWASQVVEIFCHPSLRPESKGLGPNPADLAAVLSPAVADALARRGIELTTYPAVFPAAEGAPSALLSPSAADVRPV